ncbi:dual specificity protein phosphatase 22 isoform X6 [Physeter macrocephalus]|uniref:Dual specificity protein phosphatase 22 isoform X6 n=1 Tax=Physeter macrocephalus TaxID=9755 RepID=A0A9W2W8A1_PHYMC|nr:dual specificity protein phosphatase 22 isoform X6 [Physeter catodon]
MGNGMNKILPGLYIGNFKDARDAEQLSKNKVTHILSVHDSARPTLEGVKYLCIPAADSPSQNLTRHFKESIQFIHECRLRVRFLQGLLRSRHRNSFSSLPQRDPVRIWAPPSARSKHCFLPETFDCMCGCLAVRYCHTEMTISSQFIDWSFYVFGAYTLL